MTHYYSYPEADVHCYKRHLEDNPEPEHRPKAQVLDVKKAVARREREMVRELDDRKKNIEREAHQARLRQEIADKKRQIE